MAAENPFTAPVDDAAIPRLEPGLVLLLGIALAVIQFPAMLIGRGLAGETGMLVGATLGGATWGFAVQRADRDRSVLAYVLAIVAIAMGLLAASALYLADFAWVPAYYAAVAVSVGSRALSTVVGAEVGAWWARSAPLPVPLPKQVPARPPDAERVRVPSMDPYDFLSGGSPMSAPPKVDPYEVHDDDPRHITVDQRDGD